MKTKTISKTRRALSLTLALTIALSVLAFAPITASAADGYASPVSGMHKIGWFGMTTTKDSYTAPKGETRKHIGVDLRAEIGDPVYAVMDGKVYGAGLHSGYGDVAGSDNKYWGGAIVIEHTNSQGGTFYALYGHLLTWSVNGGDTVRKGQQIGTIRSWYGSPHLHLGIFTNSAILKGNPWQGFVTPETAAIPNGWVDPLDYLNAYCGGSSNGGNKGGGSTAPAPETDVRVTDSADGSGDDDIYQRGDYPNMQGMRGKDFNNKVSWIHVPAGMGVVVFTEPNFGGQNRYFLAGKHTLDGIWDNNISSMKVMSEVDARNWTAPVSSTASPTILDKYPKQNSVVAGGTVEIYVKTNSAVKSVELINEKGERCAGAPSPAIITTPSGEKEWLFGWQTKDTGDRSLRVLAHDGENYDGNYAEAVISVKVTSGGTISNPQTSSVRVTEANNGSGLDETFPIGDYPAMKGATGKDFRDKGSWFDVPAGLGAIVFTEENFGGIHMVFTQGVYVLTDYPVWNNNISSMKVMLAGDALSWQPPTNGSVTESNNPYPLVISASPKQNTVTAGGSVEIYVKTNGAVKSVELINEDGEHCAGAYSPSIITTLNDSVSEKEWTFYWQTEKVGGRAMKVLAYSNENFMGNYAEYPLSVKVESKAAATKTTAIWYVSADPATVALNAPVVVSATTSKDVGEVRFFDGGTIIALANQYTDNETSRVWVTPCYPVRGGKLTITAKAYGIDGEVSKTFPLTVTYPEPRLLSATAAKSSISLGETIDIIVETNTATTEVALYDAITKEFLVGTVMWARKANSPTLEWRLSYKPAKSGTREFLVRYIAPKSETSRYDYYTDRTVMVTVKEAAKAVAVTGVSISQTTCAATVGNSYKLTATVTPSNATNKAVTWTSSDTNIATVSADGVVTAKKAGTATITAKTSDGGFMARCAVTVKAATSAAVKVTGVTLSKSTLELYENSIHTLTANVSPSNAANKAVSWTSSNTNVAIIDGNGTVVGLKSGTATVTAVTNDGGYAAKCFVTVKSYETTTVKVTGISLSQTTAKVVEGDSFTLTATVSPSNAVNKGVTWSSSDYGIASIITDGSSIWISGKKSGTATITAKTSDGGYAAKCLVTVVAKAQESSSDFIMNGSTLTGYRGTGGIIKIPSSVVSIADGAFADNATIQSVSIENPNCKLGVGVFARCANLQTVLLPSNITIIPESTFYDCEKLSYASIPDSVGTIGRNAFRNTGITVITLPQSLTSIKEGAFEGSKLQSAIIPSNLNEISHGAFFSTPISSVTFLGNPSNIYSTQNGIFGTSPTNDNLLTSLTVYCYDWAEYVKTMANRENATLSILP